MNNVYFASNKSSDWRKLLVDPEKQWVSGYSAFATANEWLSSDGWPETFRKVFANSTEDIRTIKPLFIYPEFPVPLDGGNASSMNDVMVIGRTLKNIVPIAVEGKVNESFSQKVAVWLEDASDGKKERLSYLLNKLDLTKKDVEQISYQLVHRTASAIIMAETLFTNSAMMIVHSFGTYKKLFDDYSDFLKLYNLVGKEDELSGPVLINGVNVYFGWIRGDSQYLTHRKLKTWSGKSEFSYSGSVQMGTTLQNGKGSMIRISSDQYKDLIRTFQGRTLELGTSRTDSPAGSIGEWLLENVSPTQVASYVGPILVNEGYARKVKTTITVNPFLV